MTLAIAVPISVTSWGRTPSRNKLKGGIEYSNHLTWTGIDVVCDNPAIWKKRAQAFCARLGLQLVDEGDHWHLEPV